MVDDPQGPLSRWSRRKAEARKGKPLDDSLPDRVEQAPVPGRMITDPPVSGDRSVDAGHSGESKVVTESEVFGENNKTTGEVSKDPARVLTEDDFADIDFDALDEHSDYTRFMAKNVPEAIRRRALRKLWGSSELFAQMDGLNDYDQDFTDGIEAVKNIATDYKVGQGFLSDEEVAEWEDLGAESKARALAEEKRREEKKREQLVRAGDISVALESPDQPRIIEFLNESERYHSALYPVESNHFTPLGELMAPHVRFVVARAKAKGGGGGRSHHDADRGQIVGCGALVLGNEGAGEIKRMWVDPEARGRGIGRRILAALEEQAYAENLSVVRLETGVKQPEAISLYRNFGYVECPPFGSYMPDHLSLFLEKRLKPDSA